MRIPLLLALCVSLLSGCHIDKDPGIAPLTVRGPQLRLGPEWSLPENWDTLPAHIFESRVLSELSEDAITPITEEDLDRLAAALDRMDASSVRAAVILGRARSNQAAEVLLHRLALRVQGPERNSDAGDVIAAAALARFPFPQRYWRLVRLVNGPPDQVHPDLEVRVECACTALHAGIDRVIPFLLQVLRIDTWEGQADELDFVPSATTTWARGRAAQALSLRAGITVAYHPDAPIADREREAQRLEELLAWAIENAAEVDYRER